MHSFRLCVILALAISAASSINLSADEHIFQQFQTFMKTHNKKYATVEEFQDRFEIFKQNYQKIDLHQKMLYEGHKTATYDMGVTEFFDITPEEFSKTHLTLDISQLQRLKASKSAKTIMPHYKNGTAPESVDWRDQGVVSPVKNQGHCGSCWAFSAIGNIEAVYKIKTGKNQLFSEQQLVDCDSVDHGCRGGLMEYAYEYLEKNGVMSDDSYPYRGRSNKCDYDSKNVKAKVNGYHFVGTQEEDQIKQLLFENGPFAIAINASPLQFYLWGVFNPWFEWICNPKSLNHGVLLVGYGIDGNTPYWIVKNSWGSHWGEKGYFRLIAGKGACGVNQYVITAEIEEN